MLQCATKTVLSTSIGEFPLNEYRIATQDRELRVLHVSTILSQAEESRYLLSPEEILPYGTMLWASSIALAHHLAGSDDLKDISVLELGAGTGLPGIVAAARGAKVTQTEINKVALELARRNLELNQLNNIEQRQVDWTKWDDGNLYDRVIGSDILYSADMHQHLEKIFRSNLADRGGIIISDPFRANSLRLFERLEAEGWSLSISKWMIGEVDDARPIGVFELQRR